MPFRLLALACLCIAFAACKPSTPAQVDPATAAEPAAGKPAGALAKAAAALNPLSSPQEELDASTALLLKASSYHAVMSMTGAHGMDSQIDFVAPDRYRMQMAGMGTQVIIGDTMYMQLEGKSMKVPMPEGTLTRMRDPMRMQEAREGMTVEDQGSDSVEGQAAKKYLVRHVKPVPGEFTMWIGSDGLPLQLIQQGQVQGKPYTMTMRYSRFNDPSITIQTPQ